MERVEEEPVYGTIKNTVESVWSMERVEEELVYGTIKKCSGIGVEHRASRGRTGIWHHKKYSGIGVENRLNGG